MHTAIVMVLGSALLPSYTLQGLEDEQGTRLYISRTGDGKQDARYAADPWTDAITVSTTLHGGNERDGFYGRRSSSPYSSAPRHTTGVGCIAHAQLNELLGRTDAAPEDYAFLCYCWGISPSHLLSNPYLYEYDSFVTFAQHILGYREKVAQHVAYYRSFNAFSRFGGWLTGSYRPALVERLERLHEACEIAAVRAHAAAKREQIQAEERRAVQAHYRHELQSIESALRVQSNGTASGTAAAERVATRLRALDTAQRQGELSSTPTGTIRPELLTCATSYGITPQELHYRGQNAYEQLLQTEGIEQLTQLVSLRPVPTSQYAVLCDMAGQSVALGLAANTQHQPAIATYWIDMAWDALDIAKAVGEGVVLGGKNLLCNVQSVASCCATTVHAIVEAGMQPWETLTATLDATKRFVLRVAHGIEQINQFPELNETYAMERIPWGEHPVDKQCIALCNALTGLAEYCAHALTTTPCRELVKYTTAYTVEIFASAAFLHTLQKCCLGTRLYIRQALHTAQQIEKERETVQKGAQFQVATHMMQRTLTTPLARPKKAIFQVALPEASTTRSVATQLVPASAEVVSIEVASAELASGRVVCTAPRVVIVETAAAEHAVIQAPAIPQPRVTPTPRRFSAESIEQSMKGALTQDKVGHVFDKPRHRFGPALHVSNDPVRELGTPTLRSIMEAFFEQHTPESIEFFRQPNGAFLGIPVSWRGVILHVDGKLHEGTFRLGTTYTPDGA